MEEFMLTRKDLGKISAQPHTTLCIQFLNRENNDKNNTFPLGKQICFTIIWGCTETLPRSIVDRNIYNFNLFSFKWFWWNLKYACLLSVILQYISGIFPLSQKSFHYLLKGMTWQEALCLEIRYTAWKSVLDQHFYLINVKMWH